MQEFEKRIEKLEKEQAKLEELSSVLEKKVKELDIEKEGRDFWVNLIFKGNSIGVADKLHKAFFDRFKQ